MRYLDEMMSNYGFDNGESMPIGIELYREVYIQIINSILYREGSNLKMVGLNGTKRKGRGKNNVLIVPCVIDSEKFASSSDLNSIYYSALKEAKRINADVFVENDEIILRWKLNTFTDQLEKKVTY